MYKSYPKEPVPTPYDDKPVTFTEKYKIYFDGKLMPEIKTAELEYGHNIYGHNTKFDKTYMINTGKHGDAMHFDINMDAIPYMQDYIDKLTKLQMEANEKAYYAKYVYDTKTNKLVAGPGVGNI